MSFIDSYCVYSLWCGTYIITGFLQMIRSELIQIIADENPHLYQRDVERIVNAVFSEITEALAKGNRVELRGFGAFSVKSRNARMDEIHEQVNQ